jgi:hypothetical protein
MTEKNIRYYIYPAIGIARVGNSTSDYLISPELIGQNFSTDQQYKDDEGKVKRQAAKFRIYAIDESGKVLEEIVCNDQVQIQWHVHLANRKAINYEFNNAMDMGDLSLDCTLRNPDIIDLKERENKLLLDPGIRKISGICRQQDNADPAKKENYSFDDAKFYKGTTFERNVYLGELRTDEQGRLLVLGGRGHSASFDGKPAITFANNNGWHDDVADGTVRASVIIKGKKFDAEPAMVAVTPPNFAPGIESTVTLLDVVENLFEQESLIKPVQNISFYRDIFPIFNSLVANQAVNSGFYFLFGENAPANFTSKQLLEKISSNLDEHKDLRCYLFNQFRPSVTVAKQQRSDKLKDIEQQQSHHAVGLDKQLGDITLNAISASQEALQADQLPPFYGDTYGDFSDNPLANLSLTDRQYEMLTRWSQGDFTNEVQPLLSNGVDDLPLQQQPQALTKGHLSQCLGGPFHPGIELTWFLRRISMWNTKDSIDPMRLNILHEKHAPQDYYGPVLTPDIALAEMFNASGPGTLTRFMGVPWQTDEASCRSGQDYDPAYYLPLASFWSARVPNQVLSERSFKRLNDANLPVLQRLKHLDYRQDWLRFFGKPVYQSQINNMVQDWDKIGIVKQQIIDPPLQVGEYQLNALWVESEVNPKFTVNDPSYRQLLHLESLSNSTGKITIPDQNVGDYADNLRELERDDSEFANNSAPKRKIFTRSELFGHKS